MSEKKLEVQKKNHKNGNWNVAFLNKLAKKSFFLSAIFNRNVISLLAFFESIAFCLCSGCHFCNIMALVILLGYSSD